MRLAVGQRPEPGAEDIDAADLFLVHEAAQTVAPFRRNDAGGVIRKPGEYGYFVTGLGPVMSEFGRACSGRAHLGREVLGDVENFHAKVESIAKADS